MGGCCARRASQTPPAVPYLEEWDIALELCARAPSLEPAGGLWLNDTVGAPAVSSLSDSTQSLSDSTQSLRPGIARGAKG